MTFLSIHSHRIDVLVDLLAQQDMSGIILVPNSQIRQWLLLELAQRNSIVMGLKVLQIDQLFPPMMSRLDLYCFVFQALKKSDDVEVINYLQGNLKRHLELAENLHTHFIAYGLHKAEVVGWQKEIWDQLPLQNLPELNEPVICFGIDYLPPVYWEALSRCSKVTIYLFSPCVDFWSDVCSDRERKQLLRYFEKRGTTIKGRKTLDSYLRDAPKNLANWGKIGRLTQQMLDTFDVEIEECYPSFEPNTLLKKIQHDLLTFQESKNLEADDSIKIFMTGTSKVNEIEKVFEEIVSLSIPYHEIAILAPDITPYVPLIQYVFGEKIPYRISGFDISSKSFFRQGLHSLFQIAIGRWESKDILTLFENPAFYKVQGWDCQNIEQFRSWITSARIKWGLDPQHRNEVLSKILDKKEFLDEGSWEKGLNFLLESIVFLKPLEIDVDLFESFLQVILSLKKKKITHDMTLSAWADWLEAIAFEFLISDADDGTYLAFRQLLSDLKNSPQQETFPPSVIAKFLTRPVMGQIHSSHLHAVRVGSIEDGALIRSRAIFLIGMDEENFPRKTTFSSIDCLKGKVPLKADFDRYLFLQTIFSAADFLRISFGHLSKDEGKPVGPSLVVEELVNKTKLKPIVCKFPLRKQTEKNFIWPPFSKVNNLPEGNITILLSDLRSLARHPWKFYLKKKLGIYLDIELEETFALQKGMLLRGALENLPRNIELPPGRLKEALEMEVKNSWDEWQERLLAWDIHPITFEFRENCLEPHFEENRYILPSIRLNWEQLHVSIVGEVHQASLSGYVCANNDNISGLLKVWPEALAVGSQVFMLKTGKLKQIANREESLKRFVEYYFHALCSPSPLIADWADPILRKSIKDLEQKMEKGSIYEDALVEWVLSRVDSMKAEEIYHDWGPFLKDIFADLVSLYPTRSYAKV